MHQQLWLDLWHHFLAVMSAEPIETRIGIGIAIAFFGVMSLTGIADSFLPRRAARRYAAMYDMMPALADAPPAQSFTFTPPSLEEEPVTLPDETAAPDEPEDANDDMRGDLRFGESSVNAAAARRSQPPPPKVFRAQKP
ncbi:MAG TPA: hypothetical protein VIM56_12515 [Rhizomicrobium sp.]